MSGCSIRLWNKIDSGKCEKRLYLSDGQVQSFFFDLVAVLLTASQCRTCSELCVSMVADHYFGLYQGEKI
ncbi:MAG: hypothetical protein IJZ34_06205 [Lachnospiraceae bacterium]|nr:hypothetical protein [Lachnospiraceae bacterium]